MNNIQEKIIESCEDAICEAQQKHWHSVRQLLRAADNEVARINSKNIKLSPLQREKEKDNIYFSLSLERGLRIFNIFTPEKPIWGVADVAEKTNLPRSSVHRYLRTFVNLGQLEPTANRKYRRVNADE